jgi:hypothetical protein
VYLAETVNWLTYDGMRRETGGWHWAPKPKCH